METTSAMLQLRGDHLARCDFFLRAWKLAALALVVLAPLVGCGANKGVSNAQKLIADSKRLREVLATVQDATSAKAAMADVDRLYKSMLEAQKAVIEHEKEHGETRGRKSTIDKIQADLAEAMLEMQAEGERLSAMKDLPPEFFSVLRRHSYEMVALSIQYMVDVGQAPDVSLANDLLAIATLYRELPPEKIVEVTFSGMMSESRTQMMERIQKKMPEGTRILSVDPMDGTQNFAIAPTSMEEVVKAIDFGRVVDRNDASGEVEFEMDAEALARQSQAELEAAANPGQVPGAALPETPPAEFEENHRLAVEEYGQPAVLRYEVVNFQELNESGTANRAHEVMQVFAQFPSEFQAISQYGYIAPVKNYAVVCEYVGTIAEIVERDDARQTLKLRVDPAKWPGLESEQLLRTAGKWVPKPTDADYHEYLSNVMWNPEKLEVNREAVEALLKVEDVTQLDKEVRKRVARNFRAIAMQDEIADATAVDGLVHYGAQYSVPVLIELLDRPGGRINNEIVAALGKLKDPRGADVLAKRLADEQQRASSLEALREIGPAGEDALVEAAKSEDMQLVRQLIDVMRETGTKKSFPTLRRLMRHKDEEVAASAKSAVAAIVTREKEKKRGQVARD